MKNKVSLADFAGNNEQKAQLQKAIRELPAYTENMTLLAKMVKVGYDALLKEGFTEEQALFLCKEI